jgi:Mycobacterium 19 kDa lipoprotein antigen
MKRRSAAAAGVMFLLIAGVPGCAQQEVRSKANASIAIDGTEQGKTDEVNCNQSQSTWFVDIRQVASTAKAIVDVEGEKAVVQTVDIQGFGGFNGSYVHGSDATADATFANRTFTINGTASGVKTGSPKQVTTNFKIVARC